jgi:quercetin dioxygenase-like cupin family protein
MDTDVVYTPNSHCIPATHAISRRRTLFALTASAMAALLSPRAKGQSEDKNGPPVLDKTGVYSIVDMPTTKSPNGATVHHAFVGTLTTGEVVDVHETTLAAGDMPHPEKKHVETMIVLVRDGELEFLMDGKAVRKMGPGDVAYSVPGQQHGLRNVGDSAANYFAIAIGRGGSHEG